MHAMIARLQMHTMHGVHMLHMTHMVHTIQAIHTIHTTRPTSLRENKGTIRATTFDRHQRRLGQLRVVRLHVPKQHLRVLLKREAGRNTKSRLRDAMLLTHVKVGRYAVMTDMTYMKTTSVGAHSLLAANVAAMR